MRTLPVVTRMFVLAIALIIDPFIHANAFKVPATEPPSTNANPVVLQYIGHSSILLISPKKLRIINDPYGDHPAGLNDFPRRMGATIVTISHTHPDHNNVDGVWGTPQVFFIPGIYQVEDVKITGYKSDHGLINGQSQGSNIVFVFEIGNIKIVHMGAAGVVTQPNILAATKNADVVVLDCAGDDAHPLKEQIDQLLALHVRTIIPGHYSFENERPYYGSATLRQFLDVLPEGLAVVEQGSVLEVTPDMPQQVVIPAPSQQSEMIPFDNDTFFRAKIGAETKVVVAK